MAEETPNTDAPATHDEKAVAISFENADAKEFENILASLQSGKIPTKETRFRLRQLAVALANQPGENFDYIEAANKAGAFAVEKTVAKADKFEMERRIEAVKQMLARGATTGEIVLHCAQTYGVKRRVVDNYIARAVKENAAWLARNRDKMEAHFLTRLDEAYRLARNRGIPSAMVQAVEVSIKILGLVKPVVQRYEFAQTDGRPLVDLPEKEPRRVIPI